MDVTWCTPKNVRSRSSTSPPVLTTPAPTSSPAAVPAKSSAVRGVNSSRAAGIANDARIARCAISSSPVSDCSQANEALDVSGVESALLVEGGHAPVSGDEQHRRAGAPRQASARDVAMRSASTLCGRSRSAAAIASGYSRIEENTAGATSAAAAPPSTPPSETHTKYSVRCAGSGRLSARRVWHSIASTVNAARWTSVTGRIG